MDWASVESSRKRTPDLYAFNEFRLTGLSQRHHRPGEARLLGCQRRGQDPAHGVQATVQPKFPQEDCATKLLGCKDTLRREHCGNNREVK
jgi:hypothetical protein